MPPEAPVTPPGLKPPDMRSIQRLLIVKLSSIGDAVHALPVTAALGEAYPHLEISWVVEQMSAPMVEGNPYLKEVIVLPADWRKNRLSLRSFRRFSSLRQEMRGRRFDMTLDLQGLSKSALVAWATGAKFRYGYDWLREFAPRLETRIPRRPESVHIVEQFLDVARFLGAPVREVTFPLHIPAAEEAAAVALLHGVGITAERPFLVINPSSGGGGNKGWGAERFAALLDALAPDIPPVVLVGAKGDLEVAREIAARTHQPPSSLVGQTNLKQLAAVLRLSALHLCGDTGSAHIAAALGTPVVSLFGRSNPARLAPYGQEANALHHREQCAAPCRHFHDTAPVNSKQKCLAPPPVCLSAITVAEVADKVREILARR
jgi:heptosyltransferase-1